jgi:hypothetical protein
MSSSLGRVFIGFFYVSSLLQKKLRKNLVLLKTFDLVNLSKAIRTWKLIVASQRQISSSYFVLESFVLRVSYTACSKLFNIFSPLAVDFLRMGFHQFYSSPLDRISFIRSILTEFPKDPVVVKAASQ